MFVQAVVNFLNSIVFAILVIMLILQYRFNKVQIKINKMLMEDIRRINKRRCKCIK